MARNISSVWLLRTISALLILGMLGPLPALSQDPVVTLRIVSPENQTVVFPGQTINIRVESLGPHNYDVVALFGRLTKKFLDSRSGTGPFDYTINIPKNAPIGPSGTVAYGSTQMTIFSSVPNELAGDFNRNGVIDAEELGTIEGWSGRPASSPNDTRDLNIDGRINSADWHLLAAKCTRPRCTVSSDVTYGVLPDPADLIQLFEVTTANEQVTLDGKTRLITKTADVTFRNKSESSVRTPFHAVMNISNLAVTMPDVLGGPQTEPYQRYYHDLTGKVGNYVVEPWRNRSCRIIDRPARFF